MAQYVEWFHTEPEPELDELGGRAGVGLELPGLYFLMAPELARRLAQALERVADQAEAIPLRSAPDVTASNLDNTL